MKINRNIVGLIAVAGAAYAAGHFGVLSGGGSGAWAQVEREPTPEELAYMKAGTPGKHHQILDQMVGEWEGRFTMRMDPTEEPMVTTGTVSRKWILDGRFIQEEVVGQIPDLGTFHGLGFVGYNNFDGQYESVWMENMSTAIAMSTGTFHPDKKVLHMAGDMRDPVTGRVVHQWGKMDLSDPDRHVYTGYSTDPDGRTYTAFEGVMERRSRK
ncbi:MAG: DUF1579 family protein [Planctomycetota bacterium]|jgi:hypothetical protein